MAKDTPKTSLAKKSASNRGFTLLEILIVITLMAGLAFLALPKVSLRKENLPQFARKLSLITRQMKIQAQLKKTTYRLVIYRNEKGQNFYWVDFATQPVPATYWKATWNEQLQFKFLTDPESKEEPPPLFQKAEHLVKKTIPFPPGIQLQKLVTSRQKDTLPEGAIYCLERGQCDLALMVFEMSNGQKHSMVLNPISGRWDWEEKEISFDQLISQPL